ncbi:copper chaperone PCu(A)C [Sphingomonas rubra]|uniref:Copper(I)-binding protein n=1 Tax=Sphingomonas rubra TaxID=634430 RepID=A0A1I5S7J7_9SPHN|nr:copper chaperone PCu(A)C [Sphingomonas rubra]SFP66725.1 hypothetical protein SAMN04488241_10526 [Sphingomonas rubra]
MRAGWTMVGRIGGIAGALMLAGCLSPDRIEAEDAWVRLPAVPGRPAVGYFTLHGGAAPTRLVAVNADLAQRTEMHESMAAGGVTTMRSIDAVPLPAGGTIAFAPGARHLMLFGVNPSLKPGGSTVLSFTFADGSRIERRAWAIGPGDPAPE